MNKIMHRTRVIRVLSVNAQQNFGRLIGISSRNLIGWYRSQMGQRVESSRVRITGESLIHLLHCLFPAANTQPVITRSGIKKESLSGSDKKLLAFCWWLKRFGSFYRLPSLLKSSWSWSRGPQRLKERSAEHTSELQSRRALVCRLLLEKRKT